MWGWKVSERMHVLVRVSGQIGPDEWETEPVIVPVTRDTTIGEICERLQARRALSKPGYATVATLVMLEGADV